MVKAKVLESRYAFADRWLRLRSDSVLLPGGRLPAPCTVFEYPDWVDVIALTGDRNPVLVEQVEAGSLELPALQLASLYLLQSYLRRSTDRRLASLLSSRAE